MLLVDIFRGAVSCLSSVPFAGSGAAIIERDRLVGSAFDALIIAHEDPRRKYHNLDHVESCVQEAYSLGVGPEAELALFYHDAIYVPGREDNEERSGDFFEYCLCVAIPAIDALRVDNVRELIMATQHIDHPSSRIEAMVMDIDMMILGGSPESFDKYDQAIRAEWTHVSDAEFEWGRCAFLAKLLDRPRIFYTDLYRDLFEDNARDNIRRRIGRN